MAEKTEIYKLIYKKDTIFQKYVRILGRQFFKKNKYIGRLIINNKIKPLKDTIQLKDIKEDKLKIKLIFFQKIQNKSCMFKDCLSLTNISQKEKDYTKKNSNDFNYYKKFNISNIPSNIVNYVTDMSRMFSNCKSLISFPDISKWNTDNVTNMYGMFYYCKTLKSLPDISKWNTNNVTNMSYLFSDCESLISLPDISKWNTNNVNDMSYMFYNCKLLMSLPDISKWNICNVNNMNYMFYNCKSLKLLPNITRWNISNVLYNFFMFINCPVKNSISYINHDIKIGEISNKYIMIYKIKSDDYSIQILGEKFVKNNEKEGIITYNNQKYHLVKELPIEKINKDRLVIEMELSININDLSDMFSGCETLLEFKEYNEISEMNDKFIECDDEEYFEIEENKDCFKCLNEKCCDNEGEGDFVGGGFSNNQIYGYDANNSEKNIADNIRFNENKYTNLSGMFYKCKSLISLPDISKWNTDNVINMSYMFYFCESLISLPDISKWNTNNVNDMNRMFFNCRSLISLPDISKWKANNLNDMSYLFSNCESLISLPDISKWNTGNVNDMNRLFYNCRSLISLPDISKWNTNKVTNMNGMFSNCWSLISLPDISKWNTDNVKNINGIFLNCESLLFIPDIYKWNTNNVVDIFIFGNC